MSAENFPAALKFTLEFEGGKSNDPRDPGGRTAFGVTQATFSHWLRARGAAGRSVYSITPEEYSAIYRHEYWNAVGGDDLPAGVDLIAFDIAVNMGVGRVAPWLRQTRALVAPARVKRLDALRCGFWRALRTFPVFGKGWLRRETACLRRALEMSAA